MVISPPLSYRPPTSPPLPSLDPLSALLTPSGGTEGADLTAQGPFAALSAERA